ncbi:MAG TPA: putative Ig domain-containing protein, partial [archaeon]|nr:putative Ig domain-containing protein [archaeon]
MLSSGFIKRINLYKKLRFMRMRSKVFRLLFLPLAVIGFIFLSGCVEQPISQPSFSAADFAECLSENGVKVYGAWWCGHCDAQKELFGDAWSSVNYIECGVPGNTEEQSQICFDAGITAYPTWEFKDGGRVQGEQGFQALSNLSNCPIPSGPAVISESKIFFEGPQQALQGTVDKEFSYSFCRPESAVSGATCGALAGATSDPINGKPPYSFTQGFSAGLLPPGLALNLNGILEGIPTLEGVYDFEVCATDSLGSEDCRFIAFNASKEENSIAEKKAEGSESMTYQIDMDITFKHVGRDKQYTERAVLSAQKTISSSGRGKFIDISGERVPIKVFVDGYLDSGCMKGGREYKVRGTYSESYEGNVEVFMAYFSEEYSDYSPPELWVSLSSI